MDQLSVLHYSFLIPLLPLLGAIVAGFFGARWLKGNSHWPIWLGVGGAAVISFIIYFGILGVIKSGDTQVYKSVHWFTWIEAGTGPKAFVADMGFFFDPLTSMMLCVVTGIGFFITVYAAGYMKGESGYFRFFAYLGLFIFAMTMLVLGNNFVILYLGWEGVGLCSYLLIGYYYEKPAAREAAKKAFLVNRVGDFGFGLGIMLIFLAFHSVSFFSNDAIGQPGVLEMARTALANASDPQYAYQIWALHWIPFLLMLGAFGKSAQFPLHVWLPDAMEGPTPVSALIHAATMVTAGIYMIARCSTLFVGNPAAMTTIACIGVFTAFMAATIALRQFDLKKVFAYSTISQLGYMFVGVGVLAPTAAAFHLVTHAFFKALLFLSSGVVMHAMLGHLDMRKMSGLKKMLPKTRIVMLVGCLALAGCPPFSGFFSKDEIIGRAGQVNFIIWAVALFTALMTAYYTFRLYFQVFEGPLLVPSEPAEDHAGHDDHGHDDHGHESAHGHGSVAGIESGTSTGHERAEAGASHEAVATGTTASSGVDSAAVHSHGDPGHGAHGHGDHNHEPMLMMLPLFVLAIGAFAGGLFNWPSESLAHWLGNSPSFQMGFAAAKTPLYAGYSAEPGLWGQPTTEETPLFSLAMAIGAIVSIVGIIGAYFLHLKNRAKAEELAASVPAVTGFLENKWYFDEIYASLIVNPLRQLGVVFFAIDRLVVDGLVSAIGYLPMAPGFLLKFATQRGYLQGYAAAMLLGIAAILVLMFVHF